MEHWLYLLPSWLFEKKLFELLVACWYAVFLKGLFMFSSFYPYDATYWAERRLWFIIPGWMSLCFSLITPEFMLWFGVLCTLYTITGTSSKLLLSFDMQKSVPSNMSPFYSVCSFVDLAIRLHLFDFDRPSLKCQENAASERMTLLSHFLPY